MSGGGGRTARPLAAVAVASVVALVVLGNAAGIAVRGTARSDRLVGTPGADMLLGLAGNDRLFGLGGADVIDGGPGRDTIEAGPGNDRIVAEGDGARDTVSCGAGLDTVTADPGDAVAADCELVSLRVSHDPFTGLDGRHQTEGEPDSFAYGSTVVAVFQVARDEDYGGAAANGFATSRDAGATWHSGLLPEVTFLTTPPGPFERASDPSVAYDAIHGRWLAASLVLSGAGTAVVVSRSADGIIWQAPVVAVAGADESPDKDWIVCDNWPASRFRGTCYLAYFDVDHGAIAVRSSRDGGATWSAPVATAARSVPAAIVNGAQPVVRRDGTLVVLYTVFESNMLGVDQIGVVRSTDGGATFTAPARVAPLDSEDVTGLRTPSFVSAEVAGDGTIWAAWSDCRFRADCDANDIVVSNSRDGLQWSEPVRVPGPPGGVPLSNVIPGLGVDPASAGARTRLGVVFYAVPPDGGCAYATCVSADVAFVGSSDAGRTWTRPRRLNPRPMRLDWLADGGLGAFVGDYVSTSWAGGRPIPVFALAEPPVAGELRQAIYAGTRIAGFPPK